MNLAKYVAIAYFASINTISVFAADPSKVKSIADYIELKGVPAVIQENRNFYTGKGGTFKIHGGLKDPNESIEIKIYKFIKEGKQHLMISHDYSPKVKKSIKFVLYEISNPGEMLDGKIDRATMIEGPANQPPYEVNLDDSKSAEPFQNAHDRSIDEIFEQLPLGL